MTKQNNCSPSRIYGPPEHTLFLGCSVMGFTATVGFNEQVTQVTIQLVQDPCSVPDGGNPKIYYDNKLIRRTTYGPDPGFHIYGTNPSYPSAPPVNAPAYFRCGEFEFTGLIQSHDESNGPDGRPVYTVVLVDPRQILAGCQLIIDNYAGSVYNVHNLINCFGFMESFGTPCEERTEPVNSDAVFGTPAGGFGGAGVNENGMQVSKIITAVSLLTSSFPKQSNVWSPYGRLVCKGAAVGGYGLIRYDGYDSAILSSFGNPAIASNINYHDGYLANYFIDLSSLPVPPSYWRVADSRISLMDFISQVCQDAGCDYFIEMLPFVTGSQAVHKLIKVRTVARNTQPALGAIASFIGDSNGVISNSKGVESRQEVTETFLVGGKRQIIFQAVQDEGEEDDYTDDIIVPYWGADADGNAIVSTKDDDGKWLFTVDCTSLNLTIDNPIGGNDLTISENELQAALAGYNSWFSYVGSVGTESYSAIEAAYGEMRGNHDIAHLVKPINDLPDAKANLQPQDLLSTNTKVGKAMDDAILRDIEKIFNFISLYATEYYGRKFMVRIPYTCKRTDSENGRIITSEEPSDGGYTTQDEILGLPNPSVLTDFFGLEDGRMGCFVRFVDADKLDVDLLDINEYGIINNKLYLKAQVEDKLVYVDETPRVIITLNQSVTNKEIDDEADELRNENAWGQQQVFDKALNDDPTANIQNKAGAGATWMGYIKAQQMFEAAAIPLKSNIHTYGPWYIAGPPGVVRIDTDDGLVPWEYGGMDTMDAAGNSKVQEGVTFMQAGEMGQITVAGIPTIPLGGELGATYGSAGTHLIENRSIVTNGFSGTHVSDGDVEHSFYSATMQEWTGLFGPNVTSINVSVGQGGFETSYTMRTYTPVFGRFARGNAERMKKFGLMRLAMQKQLRLGSAQSQVLRGKFAAANRKNKGAKAHSTQQGFVNTPHQVLVGTVNKWGDNRRRVSVVSMSLKEATAELSNGYINKAIISWDGIFRPFQSAGTGTTTYPECNLPILQIGPDSNSRPAAGATGPLLNGADGMSLQYTGVPNGNSMNPFYSPHQNAGPGKLYFDEEQGHDFEILARGPTPPGSSLVLPIQGYNGEYKSDYDNTNYRGLAFRGPLVMQAWGLDTNGKPIPNRVDTEAMASGGNFEHAGLKDKFLEGWLQKPHTWPVGMVDLRWDRRRAIWTIPGHRMLLSDKEGYEAGESRLLLSDDVIGGISVELFDSEGNDFAANAHIAVNDGLDIYAYEPTGNYTRRQLTWYDSDAGLHRLIRHQPAASLMFGALASDITTGSGLADVTGLQPIGGIAPSGTNQISASNDFEMAGSEGAICVIAWNVTQGKWILIQVKCG